MSIAPCQPGEAYFQTYYQLHQRRNRQISASLLFNGQSVPWSIQSSCQAHISLYSPLWSQQPATMEGLWLVMHLKVMHLLYFTTKDEHMTWCKLTQLKTAGAPGPDIWEFWSVSLYEPTESYCNAKKRKTCVPISRSCQECAATDRFERDDMIRSFSRGTLFFSSAMLLLQPQRDAPYKPPWRSSLQEC